MVGRKTLPSLKAGRVVLHVTGIVLVAKHWHQAILLKLVIQEIDQVSPKDPVDIPVGKVQE